MRNYVRLTVVILLFFSSCQKADNTAKVSDELLPEISQRNCAAAEVLEEQLAADPGLAVRMQAIENFTKKAIQDKEVARLMANVTIQIPVVVNVLYRSDDENISDAQIQSQIDVLNEDYQGKNSDLSLVPTVFKQSNQGFPIEFVLKDIVRKKCKQKNWAPNDAMKKSSQGGIDPTDPQHNLNMWSCNLGQSLLGYAQFPGGKEATDGVVILYASFGSRTKYPGGTYINKYDKGRTATHEVGHWMNLRHIWGDAACGNDLVGDTPPHKTANYGCPGVIPITCPNTTSYTREMTMNYMDYTDDGCMYLFSNGQKDRMMAIFANGGPRYALAQ